MRLFSVTFEITTPESADAGEAEERGFICQGARLREAISEALSTRTAHADGLSAIEPSETQCAPRWVSFYHGQEFFTGAYETRAIHFPPGITDASAHRLARIMGARA